MKKVLICLIFVTALFMTSVTVLADKDQKIYPINTDSKEWKNFQTHDEMINACKVDSFYLEKLSTEDLLRAVLEYPLICDIFAYNSLDSGIKQVSKYCDALALFLMRSDAREVVISATKEYESIKKQMNAPEALVNVSPMVIETLNAYMERLQGDYYETTVQTPGNHSVLVRVYYNDLSDTSKTYLNNLYCTTYPNATFVSTSTVRYNCHSFAWYSSAVSTNVYWMPDPYLYMHETNGYTQTYSVFNATKVFYYSSSHSAVMYSPVDTTNSLVISKWGEGPLMIHAISYCPFSGGVTLWH